MESDASPKHNGWDKPFIAKASALYKTNKKWCETLY